MYSFIFHFTKNDVIYWLTNIVTARQFLYYVALTALQHYLNKMNVTISVTIGYIFIYFFLMAHGRRSGLYCDRAIADWQCPGAPGVTDPALPLTVTPSNLVCFKATSNMSAVCSWVMERLRLVLCLSLCFNLSVMWLTAFAMTHTPSYA